MILLCVFYVDHLSQPLLKTLRFKVDGHSAFMYLPKWCGIYRWACPLTQKGRYPNLRQSGSPSRQVKVQARGRYICK